MDKILEILTSMPEYKTALETLFSRKNAAITGIGQINRSHIIAGMYKDTENPLVVICQDEIAARRLNEELKGFLGIDCPILPTRELTFYDSAGVSRGWEQKRLRQLYELANGNTKLQIMSWEAMSQRTIPPETLQDAVFSLKAGLNSALILGLYKPLTAALRRTRLLPSAQESKSAKPGLYLFALGLLATCILFLLVLKGIL